MRERLTPQTREDKNSRTAHVVLAEAGLRNTAFKGLEMRRTAEIETRDIAEARASLPADITDKTFIQRAHPRAQEIGQEILDHEAPRAA